ncbi:UDP-N-acetylglucosamine 2-epimerase (non-hydrolyzing) [Georgenia satyanarayanai]|uniref:non-hydrolyzing UDP-N-acetylglucosamine 2-epimerase n=1 Tax=Georgenia satyanarayanai TaxID=860221 RepID=UPI002040AB95|nr:UDP-N-acetylglucosamine 2-epimerase (non-hydrolyzing) [Georgenia satyanarayanai]MCM3661066.1 UDP-N-acetylglucosamine 2-epimerase (non-hydrolyzing) [Georgenia satyanarayanai]
MKVLSVVGARPQFVKLSPVAHALESAGHDHVIVHTGQHYDAALSDVFFADLGIQRPDVNLHVGSGSHAEQTGAMLPGLERAMLEHRPDWVLVYGDTNSTVAAALAAVKIHQPVAHLEAGLRSFNRLMPEEHNRVMTDHAADLLLAPTEVAVRHLRDEGLGERTVLVGDVMADVLFRVRDARLAGGPTPLPTGVTEGDYLVATIHRAENTDDPARLSAIIRALAGIDRPVLLLAHPRLRDRSVAAGIPLDSGAVTVLEPQPYPRLVDLVARSAGVVTDSGGLQKEAFLLRVPCTTLRHETEWVETVELGWNVLDGALANVAAHASRPVPPATDAAPYGRGDAAMRVVEALAAPPRVENALTP